MRLVETLRRWVGAASGEPGVAECVACGVTLDGPEAHCPNCGGARREATEHVPVYWELD